MTSIVRRSGSLWGFGLIGDEEDTSSEPSWGMDCSKVVRVIELHISSPILAAKSPFFYKVINQSINPSFDSSVLSMCVSLTFFSSENVLVVLQWHEGI